MQNKLNNYKESGDKNIQLHPIELFHMEFIIVTEFSFFTISLLFQEKKI